MTIPSWDSLCYACESDRQELLPCRSSSAHVDQISKKGQRVRHFEERIRQQESKHRTRDIPMGNLDVLKHSELGRCLAQIFSFRRMRLFGKVIITIAADDGFSGEI